MTGAAERDEDQGELWECGARGDEIRRHLKAHARNAAVEQGHSAEAQKGRRW